MPSDHAFSESPLPLFAQDEAEPVALTGRLPSYIRDHRRRLRERFMAGGPEAVPDYELLELVLFGAVARQDMKPLARRLLEVFGDFNGVVSAPPARLAQVEGAGEAVVCALKVVEAAVDHVPVYPREVVKRALELNASALILVHNHPSGDPTPSDSDVAMTYRIRDAAEALGLVLHDHLIVGRSRELSFRSAGYL